MSGKSTIQTSSAPFYSTGSTPKLAGNDEGSGSGGRHSDSTTCNLSQRDDRLSATDSIITRSYDQERLIDGELENRKHRARNQGGFLLQPPSAAISEHNATNPSVRGSGNSKGKGKIEHGDLILPKRRAARQRPQSRTAVGSSPLSIELFHAAPKLADGSDGGFSREETLLAPPRTSNSSQRIADGNAVPDSKHVTDQYEPRQGNASGLGDPAQIVNLALNLSQSRRRTFSATRSLPMGPMGNRWLPSLSQHGSISANGIPGALPSGGSLRQYMQQQRQASRNVSPRSNRQRDREISFPPSPRKSNNPTPVIHASQFDIDVADEVIFKFSDATLARAEKARVALELCYEYRRLLDYLPAIPRPPRSKSASSRPTTRPSIKIAHDIGREYNPLQYIRNRRSRGREQMLDAEEAGWKDLDRVRNWVDTVAHEAESGPSMLGDQYSLPLFETSHIGPSSKDPALEPNSSNPTGHPTNKPRSSKLDRSIMPWDLLADAYWSYQDENLKMIEDPGGLKIFASTDATQGAPSRTSHESARGAMRRSESITRQISPEKPISLITSSHNGSGERGRQHAREPNTPISNDNGSRDRKRLWPRGLIRSRSSSSSNKSLDGGGVRDSNLFARRHQPDSTFLEKQMRELLKKEAENERLNNGKFKENESSILDGRQEHPVDGLGFYENPLHSDTPQTKGQGHIRSHSEQVPEVIKSSLNEKSSRKLRPSLDEPVAAVSKSSSLHDFEPGKVVDSSPFGSQPVTPKLPLPPELRLSKPIKEWETQAINDEGLRTSSKGDTNLATQDSGGSKSQDTPYRERIANFGSGLLAPMTAEAISRKFKRTDDLSTRSIRDKSDTDSRFRGFLKGARISDLKAGGKIRKKEKQNDLSQTSSTLANYASEESDAEADMSGIESGPEDRLPLRMAGNGESASLSQTSAAVDRPRYHITNLPNFRSPFNKDEQPSDISKDFSSDDHITRQQMTRRVQGRPSRFDRLAPPRIDIEGTSPSPSPPMTRTQTRDTEISYDESRRSSGSQSDTRLPDGDRQLQMVLGSPGSIIGRPPVSLLSSLESRLRRSSERKNHQGEGRWSVSDQEGSGVRGSVTTREIARSRALLLSSGVKANEIIRRAQEVREVPSEFLRQLQKTSNRPHIPRSQEHIVAARMLMSNIETSNRQLKNVAEIFSHTTVEALDDQIRAVEELVTYKLTPTVRAAADDADDFSAELTTTHTLAVKQLHDSVNILLRRRRRRFRWVRRGGYLLLEWTLVAIMWFLWFIVVIIRLVRSTTGGFIRALIRGVRWFFWM